MTSRALWFGPPGRPLFARLHMPEGGAARGAVVLCPPFGIEAQAVGRAYRALGEQLAQAGLVALHIDYDGSGDSAGSEQDPGRLEAWQGSVQAAVELMRSSGARHVSVVGMRLGATIAASVAAACHLDGLVLWDPCESGRVYLREQALLRSVYVEYQGLKGTTPAPGPEAGAAPVETLGGLYQPDTAKALARLDIASAPGTLAGQVLALFRPERPARPATLERLEREHLQLGEAAGQEALLSVWPLRGLVPNETLSAVVTWLAELAGPSTSPVAVAGTDSAVMDGPDGEELVEKLMALGPHQLFGILTSARSGTSSLTVVLLTAGRLDHLGPGRLWVDLARSWAATGTAVVRVDLSGLGDSPVRPGRQTDVVYSADAPDDIADVVRAVSPDDPSAVALVGLCSGGYHAILAGATLHSRAVLAINPVWPPLKRSPVGPGLRLPGTTPAPPAAAKRATSYLRRYSWVTRTGRWALDLKWWVVNRTGGRVRPALAFKHLADSGASTLVVCRHYESRLIARGEGGVLRRLRRQGRFRMDVVPGTDHSLYLDSARQAVVPILTDQVREWEVGSAATPALARQGR